MLMVLTPVPQYCVNSLWHQRMAPFPWLLVKPQHQGALSGGYRCDKSAAGVPCPSFPTINGSDQRFSVEHIVAAPPSFWGSS